MSNTRGRNRDYFVNSTISENHSASREEITLECIDRALKSVRQFLGLDLAFISEFGESERTIRHLDYRTDGAPLEIGMSIPFDRGYCLDIAEGRLPEIIPDTHAVPLAAEKPETGSFPIGAHAGVVVPLRGGGIYGTLCCLNRTPVPDLGARDLQVMKAVAQLIGSHLDLMLEGGREKDVRRMVIEAALSVGMPEIAYQPVISLATGKIVAAEALSRFNVEPLRTPDKWFADAADVGLELVLSEVAIRRSLEGFADGFSAGLALGLNMSPRLICELDLKGVFDGFPLDLIVIEVTEHEIVEDYERLIAALAPLRLLGVQIAIDDMGSGYSNIKHVLKMVPNCVKLDSSLVKEIDSDPMKQAWLAGIMEFARRAGCDVLAEGIERQEELSVLQALGVTYGQGFLLGRPMVMENLLAAA